MSATPVLEGTTPLIADTLINTYQASEDLVVGRAVELSGDWAVKKTVGPGSTKFRGITLTAASNGQKVTVVSRGLCRVLAYGTLTAGDQVGSQNYGSIAVNTNKNTEVFGQVVQGASSGGTAVIALW